MRAAVFLTLLLARGAALHAQERDSVRHWGAAVGGLAGKVLAIDSYTKKWLQEDKCYSLSAELLRVALPSDSDAYASDYGYPTFSFGVRYAINNKVRMRRYADPDWGKLQPVDFDSRLGNTLSFNTVFYRPIVRSKRWEAGYSLSAGIGYSHTKYNKNTSPDNEFIGSRWLIYFAASAYAAWHIDRNWAVRGSLDFYHHSNGALNRPNKGSNTIGPAVSLMYVPYYDSIVGGRRKYRGGKFDKYFYVNITAGVGGKVLNEDWQLTQFRTDPDDPDYRRGRFHFYTAYSFQADCMCRYARRWASGLGFDVFYGTYADRVAAIDESNGVQMKHSPWSAGVAAKHQVFYHNWSLAMSFGVYLYRHMGENASIIEAPYYERIGLHYAFPVLGGIELGVNVKAHKTKADLTELVVAVPIVL